MFMTDFEYNGEKLSDYGLMPCFLDNSPESSIDVGNSLTINQVKAPSAIEYISVGYTYDDVLTKSFQTCRVNCTSSNLVYITDTEINNIMRWLNRKGFYKFKPIYDGGEFADVYFKGTFNVKPIISALGIIGLDLEFTANASYGFIEATTYTHEFTSTTDTFTITDESDEVGHIYCTATITCLEDGDLKIANTNDTNNQVVINGCTAGEVITMNGAQKIISSSLNAHTSLPNDFNYNYLRINNTYENRVNVFTSSIKCTVTLEYSPIRKVGLII